MNNKRRKRIEESTSDFFRKLENALDEYLAELTEIRNEEQDSLDCLPESLQDSEKAEDMESCIEAIGEVLDAFDLYDIAVNYNIDNMLTTCGIDGVEY